MDVRDKTKFDLYNGPFDSQLRCVVVIKNMSHNRALVTQTFEGPHAALLICMSTCSYMYTVRSYQIVYFTAFLSYST